MAFKTWYYTVIYNNGITEKGGVGASSYNEAYSKVKQAALIRANVNKGIADIQVYE